MIAFCIHFLMLRGFYAREDTRTPFFIQVVVASVNIVLAVTLTHGVDPDQVAARLALAYGLGYVVGSILSVTILSMRIGRVIDRETLVFVGQLVVCCAAAAAVMLGLLAVIDAPDRPLPALGATLGAGVPGGLAFLLAARLVGLDQLRYLVSSLRNR